VIGDREELADVDDGDVLGLLVGRRADGASDPLERRQCSDARAPSRSAFTLSMISGSAATSGARRATVSGGNGT
jgi:hypothetical protein